MMDRSAIFKTQLQNQFPEDFFSTDSDDLKNYGRDWTKMFPPNALAIAFPRSTQEVSKLLRLCNDLKIPVVPSGGRTGLAGGAVASNDEMVLSLKRMNQIGEIDRQAFTVRVGAGAITQAVHEACAPFGLTWPVDFASKGSSAVGGNISTNAGGVRVIRYGLTRNWVLGLQVVLMNGQVLELNGALEKNNTGLDLRQMFIGTEGTLGVITEATLKLARLSDDVDVFLFSVKDFPSVLTLFETARQGPFTLNAFETFSDACLKSVVEHRGLPSPFSNPTEAYVLMEVEKPQTESGTADLENWLAGLFENQLILDGILAQNARDRETFWSYREGISESVMARGYNHKNDVSLPICNLNPFVDAFIPMMEKEYPMFRVFVFGHIGDGNLHINVLKPADWDMEKFKAKTHEVDEGLFQLINRFQGSVSAEHGIGLLKKDALRFSRSPEELELFRSIKRTFDPNGLLNPGKIFDL